MIEFDKPEFAGSLTRSKQESPYGFLIRPGATVTLRYQGKLMFVEVTRVLDGPRYEGIVREISGTAQIGGLKRGDAISFVEGDIEYRVER